MGSWIAEMIVSILGGGSSENCNGIKGVGVLGRSGSNKEEETAVGIEGAESSKDREDADPTTGGLREDG